MPQRRPPNLSKSSRELIPSRKIIGFSSFRITQYGSSGKHLTTDYATRSSHPLGLCTRTERLSERMNQRLPLRLILMVPWLWHWYHCKRMRANDHILTAWYNVLTHTQTCTPSQTYMWVPMGMIRLILVSSSLKVPLPGASDRNRTGGATVNRSRNPTPPPWRMGMSWALRLCRFWSGLSFHNWCVFGRLPFPSHARRPTQAGRGLGIIVP